MFCELTRRRLDPALLWESDRQRVSTQGCAQDGLLVRIPFSFDIPAGLPESSTAHLLGGLAYLGVRWRVAVSSEDWQKGQQETFIVPVFEVVREQPTA